VTDVNVGQNIGFAGDRGGWVVLCTGSCTTTSAATAVDAIAFASSSTGTSTQPPALPVPLTFAPPVTGVSSTNEDSTSFVRVQVTGVTPIFKSTDWTLGAPTR
jgi:hypothetical protein